MSSRQWVQCSGKHGQRSEFWWPVSGVKVWQKNGGGEQVHEVWCDGWCKTVRCAAGLVRQLGRPACSRSSVAVPAMAVRTPIWKPEGRPELQCSARTAASEYCRLELHAAQCYSSPAGTVPGCTPEWVPAQLTVGGRCVGWLGHGSYMPSPPMSHGCRTSGGYGRNKMLNSASVSFSAETTLLPAALLWFWPNL